jgi:hypothetical protein
VELKELLPLMARLRAAAKDMKYLWANSSMQRSGRDKRINEVLALEDRARTRIEKGELTLESRVTRARI